MCKCLGAQKLEWKPKGPRFIALSESTLNCSTVLFKLDLANLLLLPMSLWAFWPQQDNVQLPFTLSASC